MSDPINWLLAGLTALVLSTAYLLDGPSDHQAQIDAEASVRLAQRQARLDASFERAARAVCGENAGWQTLPNGSLQCLTKRGHKTSVVAGVQP